MNIPTQDQKDQELLHAAICEQFGVGLHHARNPDSLLSFGERLLLRFGHWMYRFALKLKWAIYSRNKQYHNALRAIAEVRRKQRFDFAHNVTCCLIHAGYDCKDSMRAVAANIRLNLVPWGRLLGQCQSRNPDLLKPLLDAVR